MDKKELTGFKKFVADNKSLLFTIPVFVVLLIIVLFVYVFNGNDKNDQAEAATPTPSASAVQSNMPTANPTPTPTPANTGTGVITLPDTERDKDSDEILRNPFATPYKVSGIIFDSKGGSIAIIEAENKSFIVKEGDNAENYFTVLNIEKESVIIEVDGEAITISLLKD